MSLTTHVRWVAILFLSACGRIAFDPVGDGSGDGDDSSSGTLDCSGLYVEGDTAVQSTMSTTVTANLSAHSESDLLMIVGVSWNSSGANVADVSDTGSNTYTQIGGVARIGNIAQAIFRAPLAPLGSPGTLTVTFETGVSDVELAWLRYRGLALVAPVLEVTSAAGVGGVASAGPISFPRSALLASVVGADQTVAAGPGYTSRQMLNGFAALEGCATTAGSYDATAAVSPSGNWAMHLFALQPR